MDSWSLGIFSGGQLWGWFVRGCFPDKAETPRCVCDCRCAVAHTAEETGLNFWIIAGIIFLTFLTLGTAAFALAVKLTVVRRGEEREVALRVKGKSRGV